MAGNGALIQTADGGVLVALANWRLHPPTPSASPATLLTQAPMLIHLANALAIWAVDVSWMQAMGANRVLEVEFAHVCVDHNEALVDQ